MLNILKNNQHYYRFVNVTGESGFMGATGILEFGPQFNYSFSETNDCHGMACDIFDTCLEKVEEEAVVYYRYAWSSKFKDKWREDSEPK